MIELSSFFKIKELHIFDLKSLKIDKTKKKY